MLRWKCPVAQGKNSQFTMSVTQKPVIFIYKYKKYMQFTIRLLWTYKTTWSFMKIKYISYHFLINIMHGIYKTLSHDCMNEWMKFCIWRIKKFHTQIACTQSQMHIVHTKMDLTHTHFILHPSFLLHQSNKRIFCCIFVFCTNTPSYTIIYYKYTITDTHIHTRTRRMTYEPNDEAMKCYYYMTWNCARPSFVPEQYALINFIVCKVVSFTK